MNIKVRPSVRIYNYIFICLLFVFGGFFIPPFSVIVGLIALIVFGTGGLFLFYSSLKPSLIINDEGICPNFLMKSLRRMILWKDIQKIVVVEQRISVLFFTTTEHYLSIKLKNPDQYGFNKYITKKSAEKVINRLDRALSLRRPKKTKLEYDIYVPSILLPSKKKMQEIFKQFPVEVKDKIEQISSS